MTFSPFPAFAALLLTVPLAVFSPAPVHAAEGFDPSSFDPAAPAAFQFGVGEADHAATFESACTSFERRELPTEGMPMAAESHVQFDCQGFDYYGAARLAEFVFVDDALSHVWVLTGAEDLGGLAEAFDAGLGIPSHVVPGLVRAYIPARAALRYDVPEALYMSESAAPFFAGWFDGLVAQQGEGVE